MSKPYVVKASPGKGRGIFATKHIAAGTTIFRDRVALSIPEDGPSIREEDVVKGYHRLSKADQAQFLSLHDGKRHYNNKIFRIWKGKYSSLDKANHVQWILTPDTANVFGTNGSTALYFEVSLINHACVPNAIFSPQDDHADVVALKPISKGQEIFISYNSLFDNLIKRHRANALRLYYGFECTCSACTLPHEEQALSDARRQLLNVLTNALENFQPIDTRLFDLFGTLDGQQAEHPAVLQGISRKPLAKPLSLEQKNAYLLLKAGLLVAEGHSSIVLVDTYADVAADLLHRMQVLDDIVPLHAVKAVEMWMQLAMSLAKELWGSGSQKSQDLQKMWKDMLNTDQMRAGMIFVSDFRSMSVLQCSLIHAF